ncbi:MAG: CRISPR-associated protein [Herpetosiphonaceae bacterium]|nr:MAG: CRISPR-associated protein [Herpetosiphonaceae bacterium]
MERVRTTTSTSVISLPVDTGRDLRGWLAVQAVEHRLTWLLAHADDGVIWGVRRGDGSLALSCDVFPQGALALRWDTLQQCRLFGEDGELLLWRGPHGWQARLRLDRGGEPISVIDEKQLLWGTQARESRDGFTVLVEGAQGIVHAPPLTVEAGSLPSRVRLLVRHYLGEDHAGVVRIRHSRLVKLISPTGACL